MRLDVKALAIASAILWGGAVLAVALSNLAWAPYGQGFLEWAASLYPGYHGPAGIGSALVVSLYAVVDGLICGALLAWIYNAVARAA